VNKSDLAVVLVLSALSVALVALLGARSLPAWSQSPVSPLPVERTPQARPHATAPDPGVRSSPISPAAQPVPGLPARLLTTELWSSPWSWVLVGCVVFGGLAWPLVALFRRLESGA
jgi:hypothetical protein